MSRKMKMLPTLVLLVLISLNCFADVASINQPDAYGRTALTHAILDGNLDTVKSLIDRGADTHVKDKLEGKTVLMTACEKYYSADDSKGIKNQLAMIALLLDKGHVNIDERDKHGATALMRVAYQGRLNVLQFLIKQGADVNAKNNEGTTPLLAAIHGCYYESGCRYQTVKALLDKGAQVNVKDEAGHTPLYYSKDCKCERAEIQKNLRDAGGLDNLDTVRAPLIIISPRDGDAFKEGDIVSFVAELSPDFKDDIFEVDLMAPGSPNDCMELKTHPKYKCKFKIPPASPKTINLFAIGGTLKGGISSEKIVINVVIPSNIVLQGLKSFQGNRLFFSRLNEKEQIYVVGAYSDGVERNLRDADSGTTYMSSNEKIVTVNSAGLVNAVGPGEAQIVVRNGDKKLLLNAVVRLKNK